MGTPIGLTFQEANDIQQQYPSDSVKQRKALLEKWSQKFGSEATYLELREGFQKIKRKDIAEDIDRRIQKPMINVSRWFIGLLLVRHEISVIIIIRGSILT